MLGRSEEVGSDGKEKERKILFGIMIVRGDVLKALLNNPKWAEKFEKAKTYEEQAKIIHKFLLAQGYKLKAEEEVKVKK